MTRKVLMFAVLALVLAACGEAEGEGGDTVAPDPTSTTTGSTAPPRTGNEVPAHLSPMAAAWETDFSNTTIDLNELLVGIPASDPRDLIRPIDDPQFEPASATTWLADQDPGVLLEIDGDARFYPLSVLTRHEIVNDTVGGRPVAVTYCPLCNTAVVFDREFDGMTLRLGVSGLLRNSDLVMWDDQTQSLWQQITGESIVGELAGAQLEVVAGAIVRWADFLDRHPEGTALGEDQGFGIRYGTNPYEFYSSRDRPYGFFQGEVDERFPALERVVGISIDDTHKAYPFSLITEAKAVNDTISGQPVAVLWGAPDTADALDSFSITDSVGIGTAVAFDPVVEARRLTFQPDGDSFTDLETGSTWSILGLATDGPLEGTQLELVPHRNEFWFAWQAFFPDADVWEG